MFGEGDLDIPAAVTAVVQAGYPQAGHVELSRHSHDAVRTARAAYAFLKQLVDQSAVWTQNC
jgi:hypothetical protein